MGGQLLTLKFSREDESEADLVGIELAARAGYDPRAGVTLWQKMAAASKGAPPQFMSTHPSGPTRIRDIEANLPEGAAAVRPRRAAGAALRAAEEGLSGLPAARPGGCARRGAAIALVASWLLLQNADDAFRDEATT